MSLSEVFLLYGQPGYRRMQRRCLERIINNQEDIVLTVGGGIVSEAETYDLVKPERAVSVSNPFDWRSFAVGVSWRRPWGSGSSSDELADLNDPGAAFGRKVLKGGSHCARPTTGNVIGRQPGTYKPSTRPPPISGCGAPRTHTEYLEPPLGERCGMVWVWPGEKPATLTTIPDMSEFVDREGAYTTRSYLAADYRYDILIDNLLDLSHADYLHKGSFSSGPAEKAETAVSLNGDDVMVQWTQRNMAPPPFRARRRPLIHASPWNGARAR